MKLDKKKEYLQRIIINGDIQYDSAVYSLLKYKVFNSIIAKLDIKSYSGLRFLISLGLFTNYFNIIFRYLEEETMKMADIFGDNPELTEEYFKCDFDKNKEEFYICMYRLIISNFIKNSKYDDATLSLLEDNNIAIKDIKDYSHEELKVIIQLMADIVLCNDGTDLCASFFYDIDKNDMYYKKEEEIERTKQVHEKLYYNYYKKKDYLKHFKLNFKRLELS